MKNIMYALKYLIKSGGNNITRIISVTLGLTVSLLVFSYVTFEASYDRFMPDRERIYQVWENYNTDGLQGNSSMLNGPVGPALMEEFPQVESATRYPPVHGGRQFVADNRSFYLSSTFADSLFFDVLDYGVVAGDPRKALADKGQMMLSESAAKKIFGEADPMGQTLTLRTAKDYPLTVVGIFRDIPKNTQMGEFEALISFELCSDFYYTGWDGGDSFNTFIKLRPGAGIGEIEGDMDRFIDKYDLRDMMAEWNMKIFFSELTASHKTQMDGWNITPILLIIGAVTLFIAAMNYILVSISLLFRRGKTVGMLKCNGARKRDIFSIFMFETLFIIILSAGLAIPLISAMDGMLSRLIYISVADLFAWERIWSPALVIIAMFALTGTISSRIFASVPVTTAFRGATAGQRWWKRLLLFAQLAIVAFSVTMLIISMRQFGHMANGDYGYENRDLLYTTLVGTPAAQQVLKDEIATIPGVRSVGAGFSMPYRGYSGQPAFDENTKELLFSCRFDMIDCNYIPTMGMTIVEGRNFIPDEGADKVIVNEEYVRLRGWPEGTAAGRSIIDDNGPDGTLYTIVGVIKDFWMAYGGNIMPIVFHSLNEYFTREDANYRSGYVMIRVDEVTPEMISRVSGRLETVYKDRDVLVESFDYYFQDSISEFRMIRNLMLIVSVVTLLIAFTGLYGYISDEINRRSKEIGIRKVNGARRSDIIALIARDAALVTIPAVVAGGAGAYFLGRMLLTMFPQKVPLSWEIFVLGALVVIVVVYAVELARTWKIAGGNPIDTIKTE